MKTKRIYEDRKVSRGVFSWCEAVLSPQTSLVTHQFSILNFSILTPHSPQSSVLGPQSSILNSQTSVLNQTPRIALSVGSSVRSSVRDKICRIIHTCSIDKYQGSQMYASYTNASSTNICIMVKEHMYMHHTYMHKVYMQVKEHLHHTHTHIIHTRTIHATYTHVSGSRSRIMDMCIIHTCIIVED